MSIIIDYDNKTDQEIKKPKNYVAVIQNDDYTTFEAVHFILCEYFNKSLEDAITIADEVHKAGKAVAGGPYSYDVCETKCTDAMNFAKVNEMPLRVSSEEA